MVIRIDIHNKYKKWSPASRFLLPSILLSPKLTNFETLVKMGFVTIILYDETKEKTKFHKDSIGLLFNPSYSFWENNWTEFVKTMQSYENLIEIVDYGNLIFLLWFKINPLFSQNLRYNFKQGKFSSFPKNYLQYLPENEQKICRKDLKYQKYLENKLGLEEGELNGKELASIPDREEYTFQYIKNEKINNI